MGWEEWRFRNGSDEKMVISAAIRGHVVGYRASTCGSSVNHDVIRISTELLYLLAHGTTDDAPLLQDECISAPTPRPSSDLAILHSMHRSPLQTRLPGNPGRRRDS